MDMNGLRCDPHFKSDYAPDTLLGSNYICHFEIIRKSLIDSIGGFRVGYEGAQDYDLFLRVLEQTTRDYADITENCLKSIFEKTTYQNFEVIIMNNNSEKKETFELFNKYKQKYSNFRVIDANYEFNYSKINNQGVREAKGK